MILSGTEIKKQVEAGTIHIVPFDGNLLNPNSYNYRLGGELLQIDDKIVDPKTINSYSKINIPEEGFTLVPGKLYLGHTCEEIGSDIFVTSLIGRSSIGRLGLYLQITADLGHVGAKHKWTLELKVVQPLKIYKGMKIGQVSFWKMVGGVDEKYNGKYSKYSVPSISEYYKEI